MPQVNRQLSTIEKTLITANLIDGFWDRWIVHGIDKDDIVTIRKSFLTKQLWDQSWDELAKEKYAEAEQLSKLNQKKEAEKRFRVAGLYYQMNYWLIPENNKEKIKWLEDSLIAFEQADQLSLIKTEYVELIDHQHTYFGRVRIPKNPKAVILIINPLDSAKEELFTYEVDFAENGFAVVSFDGPGQGQTFTNSGMKGTKESWKDFVDHVIEYAANYFSNIPIHLFGTSSGAAWALYGSCHPDVTKVVAVSPAFITKEIKLPDYFVERTQFVLEEQNIIPDYGKLIYRAPVMLVHGKQDVMVNRNDVIEIYKQLPVGKKLLEYEDEGHCCNYKLPELRNILCDWFLEVG